MAAASCPISIELEKGIFPRLNELYVSSGEGIFAVVVNGSRFEEIGVIENVTTLASGEISDGDGISVLRAADIPVDVVEVAFSLLLCAVLMSS